MYAMQQKSGHVVLVPPVADVIDLAFRDKQNIRYIFGDVSDVIEAVRKVADYYR